MKNLLLPALVTLLFTSCNDSLEKVTGISKPQLRSSDLDEERDLAVDIRIEEPSAERRIPAVTFPLEKTLTDVKGRTIKAKILAKKGNQLSIEKVSSNQHFVLTLEMLAEADRVALASIADGGNFDSGEAASSKGKPALSSNRRAVWHSHINNAEKEASELGIPLLVAVSNGANRKASEELEKTLVYSSEFKKWADKNVALCLVEVGSGSREGTFETWVMLAKYGIKQSRFSTVALIDPGSFTSELIPLASVASPERAVSSLDTALNRESKWQSICAAPAPTRQASPFKVNRRASAT